MAKEEVKSSNVAAMDYDESTRQMIIYYRSGTSYRYEGVKKEFAESLKKADSFGSMLHRLRKQWKWEFKKL